MNPNKNTIVWGKNKKEPVMQKEKKKEKIVGISATLAIAQRCSSTLILARFMDSGQFHSVVAVDAARPSTLGLCKHSPC